jgi:exopolysaccharide biosynthesis predicted pyruvyltransferase EpsI
VDGTQTLSLAESAELLREAVGSPDEHFWFYRAKGNVGDSLIEAGTTQLLEGYWYDSLYDTDLRRCEGRLLVIGGGGGWCHAWRHSSLDLIDAERGFEKVVVFPSTFDVSEPLVRMALADTKATLFARERRSFEDVGQIRDVTLTHCPAFFFDFEPYMEHGTGTLYAYRRDRESAGKPVPPSNVDISLAASDLDNWLRIIAEHEYVHTDRAHVAIAAALLGKKLTVRPTAYFKVRSIVETWLGDYDITWEAE